jgi:hypothetical protein
MNVELTEDNFTFYAMKHYDNPSCSGIAEFNDDLKRFRYLKRLFKKYKAGSGVKERLILNHIVVLHNLFGPLATVNMLFFKIDKKFWPQLKTFLVFLSIMPVGFVAKSSEEEMQGYEIPLDEKVADTLGKI